MNFYHFIFLLLFFFSSTGQNHDAFILYDSEQLDAVKRNLKSGSASPCAQSAYQMLLSQADNLLEIENPTVVDKTIDPPSGDKHDYLSISRYWWPDPEKEDGLPWIRKDGITNPETQTDAVDRNRLGLMTTGVKYLSLAYYFTEGEQYAQKAISMLNTWFLVEETRMNPHLEYSQSVPGNLKGRRSGILDGRLITLTIPDAISILRHSSHWTQSLENGMKEWFTNYLTWLTESDLGREGAKQVNNHGSWYRIHVAVVSLFVGQQSMAEKMIYQARESLEYQLDDEGRQLHEIERTRSFFYSCFNLEPLIMLAQIGDRLGIDLWQYKSVSGKSLPLAVGYLTPVIDGKEWIHPSKEDNKIVHLIPILYDFHAHFKDENYEQLLEEALTQLSTQDVSESEKTGLLEYCLLDGLDLKFD
ncbi:alginate lyase family protein [Ekhidna sp.]|uniref:alginate lyase family protein n=1 Tax=Ekhidna sp. TaxID=2608089 RepID=UPI00351670A1